MSAMRMTSLLPLDWQHELSHLRKHGFDRLLMTVVDGDKSSIGKPGSTCHVARLPCSMQEQCMDVVLRGLP